MKSIHFGLLTLAISSLFLGGCAAPMVTKRDKFPLMYEEKPQTIFVLPPINSTTAADAKEYYTTAVPQPLAFAGFYVFPVEFTGDFMKSQGLYDTETILDQPLNKFSEVFGADAVLFTHIKKWDKSYLVLVSNLTVTIDAKLKSTKTNRILWEYSGTIVADLSGQSSTGNPLVDLIAKAVITGINTAAADYVPYAQLATTQLLQSVPFAKYHRRSGQDGADKIVDQKPSAPGQSPPEATTPVAAPAPTAVAETSVPNPKVVPVPQSPAPATATQVDPPGRPPTDEKRSEVPPAPAPAAKSTPPKINKATIAPAMPQESSAAPRSSKLGLKVYLLNNEIWVESVAPASAAAASGLRSGDKVVALNREMLTGERFPTLKKINSAAADRQGQIEISWQSPGSKEVRSQLLTWEQ